MTATPVPSLPLLAQPVPGDIVAGKYRIERVLGEGGMGTVFAACHLVTEKRCALKWLRPDRNEPAALARFQQEARAAGRINHPNVVAVYDVGEHRGAVFLIMELLEGSTLRSRLEAGPLSVEEGLDLVAQATRGVAAAHAASVLHRDLKPENLVITVGPRGEPMVKILDFGISKIEQDTTAELVTRSGVMIGTPLYMAPERLFGEPSDARADVYALGVILYECLTGTLPHYADNAASLGRRFAKQTPATRPSVLRPGLPELVDDVVMHALSLNVARRIQSAAQLSTTLDELLAWIGERTPTRAVSYASSPIVVAASQTTIDSTTGSGRAGVRRDHVAMTAGEASTGALVVRPRRMRLLGVLAALTALLAVLWWAGTRENDAPSPRPSILPVRATALPPTALSTPPAPAAIVVPPPSSDVGVTQPAEPVSPTPGAPARADKLEKRRREKQSAAPPPSTPPEAKDTTPAPSEVGRSKSQFTPNDFY